MEETKKFCVYAADDHEAYIVRLDEPERYYEINRNQLVEDRRPLAEQAMINAKYRKYLGPELNEFLLEWAEKDYPERVDKARASLEKAKEVAKRTLCDLFIEEKRKLKERPKKPYKARIKIYKEYLYPAVHRTGFVYFSTLDNALDALYNAWKDINKTWGDEGKLEEMFQ